MTRDDHVQRCLEAIFRREPDITERFGIDIETSARQMIAQAAREMPMPPRLATVDSKRIGELRTILRTSCAAALLLMATSIVAPPADAGMGHGGGGPSSQDRSASGDGNALTDFVNSFTDFVSNGWGWDFWAGTWDPRPPDDRKKSRAYDPNDPNVGVSYGPALNGRD